MRTMSRRSACISDCTRLRSPVRIEMLNLFAGLLTSISSGRAIRTWVSRSCRRTLLEKAPGKPLTWSGGTLIWPSYLMVLE